MGLVAGCTHGPEVPPEVTLTPVEEQGYQVFLRERCFYSCHAVGVTLAARNGTGEDIKVYPPDLRTTPRRSADWYRAYLVDPQAVLPRSAMPAFGYLSNDDIKSLVVFLRRLNRGVDASTLKRVSAEDVPQTPRDLTAYQAGRVIYRLHCLGCHGEWGNGSGPVGHLLLPEPRDFTDSAWMSKQTEAYLFSVITNGKPNTAMPAFSDTLSPEERSLVLRYVEYFADPVSRERMELGFVLVQNP
jgi:mono/diheme cytochrome c family protein